MTTYLLRTGTFNWKQSLLSAAGLTLLIVGVEYLARHFVMFWLPMLGAYRVNDMIVGGLFYAGLVWLTIPPPRRHLAAIHHTAREILACAREPSAQRGASLAVVAIVLLAVIDQLVWGTVQLPFVVSPWRWETTLLKPAAPLLVAASLLLVNGVVIPFAEEWLWRGLVQPRFVSVLGWMPGLLLTSVLFSLKHAVVDGSLGRLLALTAFGLVMGTLGAQRGWRSAAAAHALANTTATVMSLLFTGGDL